MEFLATIVEKPHIHGNVRKNLQIDFDLVPGQFAASQAAEILSQMRRQPTGSRSNKKDSFSALV